MKKCMPLVSSLKKKKDFLLLYKTGKFYSGRHLVVYVIENTLSFHRLGISVSKKVGNSVCRNRIRRLVKENFRQLVPFLLGYYDIVIVARKNDEIPSFIQVKKEMKYLFKKLNVISMEKKDC